MNQANDEKIDVLKSLPETPTTITLDIEERKSLTEATDQRRKMARRTHFRVFTLLLVSLLAVGVLSKSIARRNAEPVVVQDTPELESFRELLNSLEPAVLHDILHQHLKEKYQHGVYQEDKKAMEVVHEQNAGVAIQLIELAKRQTPGNGTTTASPSSTPVVSTSVVVSTSTAPTSSVIVTRTTSAAPTSATSTAQTVQSTTQVQPTSAQPSSSATRAPSSGSTVVSVPASESKPSSAQPPSSQAGSSSNQATGTSTQGPSQSSSTNPDTTSQATSSSPQVVTTTASNGQPTTSTNIQQPTSTSVDAPTTVTEAQSSTTQQIVYKTTLANGSQSTVTSITVVPAANAGAAQTGASGSKTNSGSASLQTNAAKKNGFEMKAAFLGAVGMAVAAAM